MGGKDGVVDFNRLVDQFGTMQVSVAQCSHTTTSDTSNPASLQCFNMMFADFIDYTSNHALGTDARILYMKDFHLRRSAPLLPPPYTTPSLFQFDALNDYADKFMNDDFRFLYIGVDGSYTPPHSDVLR